MTKINVLMLYFLLNRTHVNRTYFKWTQCWFLLLVTGNKRDIHVHNINRVNPETGRKFDGCIYVFEMKKKNTGKPALATTSKAKTCIKTLIWISCHSRDSAFHID